MCGIFAYIGRHNPRETALAGLKKLEYRGYDSAGLAGIKNGKLYFWKEVGKVAELEKEITAHPVDLEVAIAQTRWATHGGVTQANAHPHLDTDLKMALVHNGIIENFASLKQGLVREGVTFRSGTDTEVIVHLISKYYRGNLLEAVKQALPYLQGSYAFVVIHADHPDTIVAVANELPLLIGIGKNESFVSSDYHAFAFHTRQAVYLSDKEIALVKADKLEIYNADALLMHKETITLQSGTQEVTKGHFEHYTLKEIFEQPVTLKSAMAERLIQEYGTAQFDEIHFPDNLFGGIERVLILGCGTSYHAGLVASYLFEEMVHIPVQVEISTEYRYKRPVVQPNTLVIAISQSGETADTLAALKELKGKGAKTLALCNVYASSIAREADGCIYLRAGPEIGVCSTKAFTSQLMVLSLLALLLARRGYMGTKEGIEFLTALEKLPAQAKEVLDLHAAIQKLAKKYASFESFFFLGRHFMYPTALEGALKLKEISYINANGYPAGEMKHGPIALINPECPTVAFLADHATYPKMLSNLMEVKARNGKVIAFAPDQSPGLEEITHDIISLPDTIDPLAPILSSIAAQLFAYYIAKERGTDIDQPRNLAKSVTVE
jgi:glucosamine--fructose-6-phosphate aminotransferase (isomerizing)